MFYFKIISFLVSSDSDKNDTVESQNSSQVTTSSLAEDHELSALPKKIVLRKAKLKVEPNSALLRGPFSSGIKSSLD